MSKLFIQKNLIPFAVALFVLLLSILAIIYSLLSGLWGFNPTDIDWFNIKLLITSVIILVISGILTRITSEF